MSAAFLIVKSTYKEFCTRLKVQLTQDQKNLIEMALVKQIPPEDAKVIEMAFKGVTISKVSSKEITITETENVQLTDTPYNRLMGYYIQKYGVDFGMIYFSAITGGEKHYKVAKKQVERMRALSRIEKQKKS